MIGESTVPSYKSHIRRSVIDTDYMGDQVMYIMVMSCHVMYTIYL